MRLVQAQAMVAAVVETAPGPVSIYVADDHGDAALTGKLAAKVRNDPAELASFDPQFSFLRGGVAVFEDRRRVGAVGVSGLPGDEDQRLAREAIERAGRALG